MFVPLRPRKAYLQIVDQIRSLIEQGKLKPGDRLPAERDLADKLGSSRATIREALAALQILGLVEVHPGQGSFVSNNIAVRDHELDGLMEQLERDYSVSEVLETRLVIEPPLAELAALRATPEDIRDIEAALRSSFENATGLESFEAWDGRFHLAIARAARNQAMLDLMQQLNDVRFQKLWLAMKEKGRSLAGRKEQANEEHLAIFRAIAARDPERARLEATHHVEAIKRNLLGDTGQG